jgi:hypothetical protein
VLTGAALEVRPGSVDVVATWAGSLTPIRNSRAETNPAESCKSPPSQKISRFLSLQCESFLLIKKEKGGEQMKIKVHVRAGKVRA